MSHKHLASDDEILEAVRVADAEAVNGLPHSDTIADHTVISMTHVKKRLHQLEGEGEVKTHRSVIPGRIGGAVLTAEVVDD